jgi:chlorite dismutase
MDTPPAAPGRPAPPPPPEMRERGAPAKSGEPRFSEKRLWMQLHVYTDCIRVDTVLDFVKGSGLETVFYLDVNDPRGIAILSITEDPTELTTKFRDLQDSGPFAGLRRRPELTMIGKTYGTGREPDLEFALLKKPRAAALNPAWPWAIWYPLRRKALFATLEPEKQGKILHEHAMIGMSYGMADYAHDVRLSCYGLDVDDNEFVIGLTGKDLHPLSHIVQEMRKTVQTSKYIRKLGPFFVGRAVWQSPPPAGAAPQY